MRRSREEFQRANPFRDPAWRANRVYALLYEGHEPSRRRDGELVHAYHKFVRRYLSIRGRKAYARLQASHPALLLVHELAMQEDREVPAILEAYLLTDLSLDEIAHRIGMTVEAATYYEQLFFCVRDRLDATDWILGLLCAQGDGEPPRPRDGTPTTADASSSTSRRSSPCAPSSVASPRWWRWVEPSGPRLRATPQTRTATSRAEGPRPTAWRVGAAGTAV